MPWKRKKGSRIASHNISMILEFSKYEWYCNCLYRCSCMLQIQVLVTILVIYIWLRVVEFKSDTYYVLIMKHVCIWCEELTWLKRYVIKFEIGLKIEFLLDPKWSIGGPTSLPYRDYGTLFLFYLVYHISLALLLWHLVWLFILYAS